jgi:hypothetical protein
VELYLSSPLCAVVAWTGTNLPFIRNGIQAGGGVAPVFKPPVLHGNGWLAARSTTLATGGGVENLVTTGQDGLDGSWVDPRHRVARPVDNLNPNHRPSSCSRAITVIELHGWPYFRNRLHFRGLDVNMRLARPIETYRGEAGCEKWNIFIWPRISLGLVAGCCQ